MLKIRIIPVLTFNGIGLIKTRQFSNPRMVGNPVQSARVYNSRDVDELIFLDIYASRQNRKINFDLVGEIVRECMMPLAIGGGVSSLKDISTLLKAGADKVIIKTKALLDPLFISEASSYFGSQCITIAVDAKRNNNDYSIYNNYNIRKSLVEFIRMADNNGAGEFFVNSVDNDGMMNGFDTTLMTYVTSITSKPVIACGGGGNLSHYQQLFTDTKVEAVASASIFHFTQFTPNDIKSTLKNMGLPVRENIPSFIQKQPC